MLEACIPACSVVHVPSYWQRGLYLNDLSGFVPLRDLDTVQYLESQHIEEIHFRQRIQSNAF